MLCTKDIYNLLILIKCPVLDINLSNIAFSVPSEMKFLYHGYNLIFMDFYFTQTNRTLKKVLDGLGFEPAIPW